VYRAALHVVGRGARSGPPPQGLQSACDAPPARFARRRSALALELSLRRLGDWIDDDLLAETGPENFSELALRFREPHAYGNAADLLRAIAVSAGAESCSELLNVVKCVYQLQYTLGLPASAIENCIQ
jgi:hypothetical protein